MVPFVCTIIKLRLNITNGNHQAMHTTKQSFPTNDHTRISRVLTHLDIHSVFSFRFSLRMFSINVTKSAGNF